MPYSLNYTYRRLGAAPGGVLNNRLSNHHVISYPRMYFLGIAALARAKNDIKYRSILTPLLGHGINMNAVLDAVKCDGKKFSYGDNNPLINQVLYAIAWKPINLFIGPSGTFRTDDPSQKYDKLPNGMPKDRQEALNSLMSCIKTNMKSVIPNSEGDGGVNKAVNMTDAEFNAVTESFIKNIKNVLAAYSSKVSDWVINSGTVNYKVSFDDVIRANKTKSGQEGKFAILDATNKPSGKKEQFFCVNCITAANKLFGVLQTPSGTFEGQQSMNIQQYLM